MKLENQVCSLELAKRLKELKVKQKSLWYHFEYFDWVQCKPEERIGIEFVEDALRRYEGDKDHPKGWYKYCISAFTVAELGEMLKGFELPYYSPSEKDWIFVFGGQRTHSITEANARAKCILLKIS